jgi:basic membrane protein A
VRIGLVFDVGGRGDKSFNDGAYAGLLRAEKELGADVAYLEPAGSEDREAAMRLFAARGMDLILGIGFIFSSDVNAVAKDYPDRKFACVDYAPGPGPMPSNVQGLVFRDEEGAFLVGAVAGLLTKSNHVGFVGGMQNPLIRKFEAGYEQGVQETCKECVVHGAYAGATPDAFRDPARGKSLAAAQIAEGADVLFHASGATGHGVFEGARDGRALAIGVDADQFDEMPGTVVTSMLKRVDVAVFEAIANVLHGRFQPGMAVFGVREGAIDYVHEGPHAVGLSSSLKERLETLKKAIAQGQIHVRRE